MRSTEVRFRVVVRPGDRRSGTLVGAGLALPCALGRGGTRPDKREGDGATPRATLRPLMVLFRPDRVPRPVLALPMRPLDPADGWCDAPADRAYNRLVRLPWPASHERLWRDDHLYDLLVVLDWNTRPTVPGRGSAIFLHLARADFGPTEGCIAVSRGSMARLLPRLTSRSVIAVG